MSASMGMWAAAHRLTPSVTRAMHSVPVLFVLACPAMVSAQMVRGTVIDATTGAPIKAADLSLYTSEGQRILRGRSDDDGKFEMVLPKGKTVYVQAKRMGYETVKSQNIIASTSELLELKVRLSVAAVPLQGIEVTARRQVDMRLQPFLDRASLYKRSGIGKIWTRAELERRNPALVSHIVDRWVPPRSTFNCNSAVAVFIDDMPAEAEDIDLLVGPEQLEGVEMYNDMNIPPDLLMKVVSLHRFGSPADDGRPAAAARTSGDASVVPPCKTVLLWRKPYGELNAEYGRYRTPLWRVLAGAAVLGALLLVEYSL